MQEIYFSVIIPVYNAEIFMESCIEKMMQQTCKDFEVILVNDGSKDSTGEICKKLEERYSNICSIQAVHGGVSRARNTGICNAKGKYVLFVDVDDFIEPEMLERLYRLSVKTEADVYFSNQHYVIRNGQKELYTVFSVDSSLQRELYTPEQFLHIVARQGNHMPGAICLIMAKREFLLENQISLDEKIAWSEDSDFCYKAFVHAKSIGINDFCGYSWSNDNPQSSSVNISVEKVLGRMNVYKKWYEFFTNDGNWGEKYDKADVKAVAQKMLSNYCNYLIEYRHLKDKEDRKKIQEKLKAERKVWKNCKDEKFKYYVRYGVRAGRIVTFLADATRDLYSSMTGKQREG